MARQTVYSTPCWIAATLNVMSFEIAGEYIWNMSFNDCYGLTDLFTNTALKSFDFDRLDDNDDDDDDDDEDNEERRLLSGAEDRAMIQIVTALRRKTGLTRVLQ